MSLILKAGCKRSHSLAHILSSVGSTMANAVGMLLFKQSQDNLPTRSYVFIFELGIERGFPSMRENLEAVKEKDGSI